MMKGGGGPVNKNELSGSIHGAFNHASNTPKILSDLCVRKCTVMYE